MRKLAIGSIAILSILVACTAEESTPDTAGSSETAYSRETVYEELQPHAHAVKDLLGANVTDARLVSALGWLYDNAPAFTVSAIRSDHHNDGPFLHSGGFCADLYAIDSSQMKKLIEAVNEDPWVAEVGLGGAYKSLRTSITHKAYFADNGQTHVHIGVKVHAGRCIAKQCDGEADVDAAVPAPAPIPVDE
jgi:hypothetical protein